MHIGNGGVVSEAGKAADLNVLADGHDLLLQNLGDGQVGAGVGAGLQSVHIGGVLSRDHGGQVLHQIQESIGLGSEIGLGVDLDHNTHAIHNDSIGDALGGNPARLLGGLGQALLPEPVDGGIHVAVGGLEGLLAVHHAHVGHFTELLNVLCGKSHFGILLFLYPNYSAAGSAAASASSP